MRGSGGKQVSISCTTSAGVWMLNLTTAAKQRSPNNDNASMRQMEGVTIPAESERYLCAKASSHRIWFDKEGCRQALLKVIDTGYMLYAQSDARWYPSSRNQGTVRPVSSKSSWYEEGEEAYLLGVLPLSILKWPGLDSVRTTCRQSLEGRFVTGFGRPSIWDRRPHQQAVLSSKGIPIYKRLQ